MSVVRKLSHSRKIECRGFERSDGLWDIEATLRDEKGFFIDTNDRKIPAGEPVHNMTLRLTLDKDFWVHACEVTMGATPYSVCPKIAASYRQLVGLQIGAGWTRKIRELFSGRKGCTHLMELLTPIATVAFQTIVDAYYRKGPLSDGEQVFRHMVNGCHALADDGEVVAGIWPKLAAPGQPGT